MVMFHIFYCELVKDILSTFLENFFSFIGDLYLDAVLYCFGGYMDNCFFTGELHGIIEQRINGNTQEFCIAINPKIGVTAYLKKQAFIVCRCLELVLTGGEKIT